MQSFAVTFVTGASRLERVIMFDTSTDITEEFFIEIALNQLTNPELEQLDMVLVRQTTVPPGTSAVAWIGPRKGTFLFSGKALQTVDTCRWSAVKTQTLETRRKRLKTLRSDDSIAKFDLIYSFNEADQVFLDLATEKGIPEEAFVGQALAQLEPEELEDLIKISVCQLNVTAETAEPWILRRNGKFFFNDDRNTDVDTRHWASVKAQAIAARSSH
jgi:hypothetical protein